MEINELRKILQDNSVEETSSFKKNKQFKVEFTLD